MILHTSGDVQRFAISQPAGLHDFRHVPPVAAHEVNGAISRDPGGIAQCASQELDIFRTSHFACRRMCLRRGNSKHSNANDRGARVRRCRCDARLYGASRHLPGYFFGLRTTITRSEASRRAPATPFRCGPPRYGCRPGEKAQPTTAICFSKCRGEFEKMQRGANCNRAKSGHFSITCIASPYSRSRETVFALAGTFRGETGASSAGNSPS